MTSNVMLVGSFYPNTTGYVKKYPTNMTFDVMLVGFFTPITRKI